VGADSQWRGKLSGEVTLPSSEASVIRTYDASGDAESVHELWCRALGEAWPVDRARFGSVVREGLVAVCDERIVGVAACVAGESVGSLQLLLVDPAQRGRGIGGSLLQGTLEYLGRRGVGRVHLAGTPGPYFWPGLPADLRAARPFLEKRGWAFHGSCWDLVRSLHHYETPADVRLRQADLTYRWVTPADRDRLLEFERAHFPYWEGYYARDEALDEAVIAVDGSGSIVGSLLATDFRRPQLWRGILGDDSGAIGAVGVHESQRGRGAGTALVAFACDQLRARGVRQCHIGWTTLLTFYGRLGFQPWREFESATHDA